MVRLLAWIAAIAAACGAMAGPPTNLGFEADEADGRVPGWFVPPVCAQGGWSLELSGQDAAQGKRCAVLTRAKPKGGEANGGLGNVMQSFDGEPYRGKRIVVTMKVRLATDGMGRLQPWLRVDRASGKMGLFDNCGDRPVVERVWKMVTMAGNVEDDAESISVGMMVIGGDGPAFVDDVTITSMDKPQVRADGPRELTTRGLANLEALTRVLGYVRHYCPSDEAAGVDWDRFSVDAVLAVEDAQNVEELAQAMTRTFGPIAPAATFSAVPIPENFDPKSMIAAGEKPTMTVAWRHRGFAPGAAKAGAIYFSERIEKPVGDAPEEGMPEIGDTVSRGLTIVPGETLHVRIPIVLYKDAQGTMPRATSSYAPAASAPELSADDRATRLAGVMLAWNVLEHHFPYFDVIKDDWNGALRQALRSAATDADGERYVLTLQRLTAHLHDGHGYAGGKVPAQSFVLPLALTFVGDEVVVENAFGAAVPRGVLPGDVITAIGGKPIAEVVAFARDHEPAATVGFFHSRAARRIRECPSQEPVEVKLRSPDGKEKVAVLKPVGPGEVGGGRNGPIVSELKPGVWYVDLDRCTDKDLDAAMPALVKAKGIIFDMRGYPNGFSMGMLGHLTDSRLLCARWEIPIANHPDREEMTFEHARWELPPIKPRLAGKVAFITDGRAISAAETFMGMVEAYKLGEIVGEPTAGTNGNVNVIKLPAEYSIAYTGMKVLKHDGSQHHGVGIIPTVPVHRTVAGIAAGKDEMMEKAVEVVFPTPEPAKVP